MSTKAEATRSLELPAPYRIVRLLGAGGAGEVYLVENHTLERVEALKVLKPAATSHADRIARERFAREVRVAQMLSHPNVIPTYSSGNLPDGRRFLTMEFVQGLSLHEIVHQRGPLPVGIALGMLAEVADALHYAHTAGVIHRDIKPHNLLLQKVPNGSIVRVLDFGMAKIIGVGAETGPQLTAPGSIFGTPEYMSPEQARGKAPDARSDIYALGCVAYSLLVGAPPFRGNVASLFMAHVSERPRPPSVVDPDGGIAADVDALVLRCLAKRVEDRFQTAAELRDALQTNPAYRPLRVRVEELTC